LVDLQKLPDPTVAGDIVHHRKFLIRGLPSDIVNGNVIVEGNSWPAMQRFLNFIGQKETPAGLDKKQLHAEVLGLRYQNPTLPKFNITYLASTGNPTVFWLVQPDQPTWIEGAPGGASPGTKVRFTRVQAPYEKFLSGRVGVLLSRISLGAPPAGNQMVFGRTKKDLPDNVITTGLPGVMQQLGYSYGPFSQYAIIGLRTKKTGRLFRQPRGRASNRP
jgi:hypothetical protein